MSENHTDRQSFDGIHLLAMIVRHWVFILIVVLLSTGISVFYSLQLPNWYASSVNTVPPKSAGGGLESAIGNISSALKDFGMTKLGGQSDGYSFLVILHSKSVRDSMIKHFSLAKTYDIPDSLNSLVHKQFADNLEVVLQKEGNYEITVWDKDKNRAAVMANKFVEFANTIAIKMQRDEALVNKIYLEERLYFTDSTLTTVGEKLQKFSSNKMLYSPLDQAKSVSSAIAEVKSQMLQNEIMYDFYKKTYGEADPYVILHKQLAEETAAKLKTIENKPGFAGNFAMKDASGIGMEYMKLYTEYETYSKLKAFLLPLIEKARLDEISNTRSLFVVDYAVPADFKDRPKRSLIVGGVFLGSLVISIIVIIILNSIKVFKARLKELKQAE